MPALKIQSLPRYQLSQPTIKSPCNLKTFIISGNSLTCTNIQFVHFLFLNVKWFMSFRNKYINSVRRFSRRSSHHYRYIFKQALNITCFFLSFFLSY